MHGADDIISVMTNSQAVSGLHIAKGHNMFRGLDYALDLAGHTGQLGSKTENAVTAFDPQNHGSWECHRCHVLADQY